MPKQKVPTTKPTTYPNTDWHPELIEHSQDLLCTHDLHGRLLSVSQAPARILGYSIEELLQKSLPEIIAPEFRSEFDNYIQEIQRTGESCGTVVVLTRRGERRIWQYHNTLQKEEPHSPVIHGIAQDVTERQHVQATLRESEQRFRIIYEKSPVGMCVIETRTGRFIKANPKCCEILGRTEKELLTRDLQSVSHPEETTATVEMIRDVAGGGPRPYEAEKRLLRPDGSVRWVKLSVVNALNEGEDSAATMVVVQDITEHKQAESSLRASENHFRLLIEQASDGIFVSDAKGRYLDVNSAGIALLGYSRKEILSFTIADLLAPYEVPRLQEEVSRLATGGVTRSEWMFRRKDGSLFPGEVTARQLPDGRLQAILRDLTEQRLAAEAVTTLIKQVRGESSEAFFFAMASCLARFLSADCAIIGELIEGADQSVKTIGVWKRGNVSENFSYTLVGTPCAEVVKHGLSSFSSGVRQLFPDDPKLDDIGAESYFGVRLLGKAGQPIGIMIALLARPLEVTASSQMILKLFAARSADEIERVRSEDALRRSNERFRVALLESPIMVCNQDSALRYTWIHNPRLAWARQDAAGRTDVEILGSEAGSRLKEIKLGVLESGVGTRVEFPFVYDGKQRYLDFTIEPLRTPNGLVTGLTCAAADVTHLREMNEELRQAKERLTEENLYLEEEIDTGLGFEEIVGKSDALKSVLGQVAKVASSDTTVLLLGETGTGKELVARALHRMSRRHDQGFVKMNCAAIPAGLLESELFGHERGAFTGAVAKKVGRLELADKGTLFLDEIGDIPLALQPKLLRVLQDHEFERLGGTQTLKVSFRLVAATNRDLLQAVREGQFRSDLYYRLFVYPVRMPPLRERRTDIPLLVEYFLSKHAKQMGKRITSVPKKTMEALMSWKWSGNIRELENFIERSVILTSGSVLTAPVAELSTGEAPPESTLEEIEREHVLRAVRESGGHLGGARGAAARLGLHRTTLQSKLKRMDIDHRNYRDE